MSQDRADHHGHDSAAHAAGPSPAAAEWDERYASEERLWTANPNPALVAEAAHMPAGTALDLGSGEGADARWLAQQGWQVTAVDISQVAIDRARTIEPTSSITWVRADTSIEELPGDGFDLVSLQYFPIPIEDTAQARRIVGAVRPGGILLMGAHAPEGIRAHGRNPDDNVQPGDMRNLMDDEWEIELHETRPRGVAAGAGHHIDDVVLRARRQRK